MKKSKSICDGKIDYPSMAKLGLNAADVRMVEVICSESGKDGFFMATWKELSLLCDLSEGHIKKVAKKVRDTGVIKYFYDPSAKKNCLTVLELPDDKDNEESKDIEEDKKDEKTRFTGPLSPYRFELFEKVQKAYHIDRSYIQIPSAMTAFNNECTAISSVYLKISAKRNAVEGMVNKIISYIEHLKTTNTWTREGGKYLPGIANLIRGGKWKTFVSKPKSVRKSSDKEALKNIFGS